ALAPRFRCRLASPVERRGDDTFLEGGQKSLSGRSVLVFSSTAHCQFVVHLSLPCPLHVLSMSFRVSRHMCRRVSSYDSLRDGDVLRPLNTHKIVRHEAMQPNREIIL